MTDALSLFLAERGFTANKVWRLSVVAWVVFAILAEGAIYLSAADKQDYIWLGLKLYFVCVALPLLFSPVLWVVFGLALYIIGQFGGKKGFSWDDGIEEAKKYGLPTLNKGGYVLLVAIPIWFVAMGLLNTKGYEDWASLFLIITPTLVYLCVRRWPTGETFEAIVRWCFIAIAVIIVGVMVFNTVSRVVTSPIEQRRAETREALQKNSSELELRVLNNILKQVPDTATLDAMDRGEPVDTGIISADDQRRYQILIKKGGQSGAAKALGSAGVAVEEAVKEVATGAPSGKTWAVIAASVAVIVLTSVLIWRIARRRTPAAATATGAAYPAARKYGFWDWVGVVISILTIAWVGWIMGPGKAETVGLQIQNRLTQNVPRPDFSTGQSLMWTVKGNPQEILTSVTIGDEVRKVDLAQELMIGGVYRDKCFKQLKKEADSVLAVNWAIERGQHQLTLSPTKNLQIRFTACYVDNPFMRWLLDVIPTF